MKTLGEAAIDLPWLAPSVASLTSLIRLPWSVAWDQLRSDPGIVLLASDCTSINASTSSLLEALLKREDCFSIGNVDWAAPGPLQVRTYCWRLATLASQLAAATNGDAHQAWIGAFLAPLGWLAAAAITPERIPHCLEKLRDDTVQPLDIDHAVLARRLGRAWRLPANLTAILGNLSLPVAVAKRLNADAGTFAAVQLAILLLAERDCTLGLQAGGDANDLQQCLSIADPEASALADAASKSTPPTLPWDSLASQPLAPMVVRLALQARRPAEGAIVEQLQGELELLHEALQYETQAHEWRLQKEKLAALAEFAAGAGHEINNPLAVISGQAQYVLKQVEWLNVPAEEIEDVGAYLGNLREKIAPSLHKIISQTQRVHAILTDLMQFARPSAPKPQNIGVAELLEDASARLHAFAAEHEVRIVGPDHRCEDAVHADPAQVRTALAALLRNAIEAAPRGGWARLSLERRGSSVSLIVEDNGPGPSQAARDHLFDPFYSGRSAGRGRGMGLPTAWRLAQQQGGDVVFDGVKDGVTRFTLMLPLAQSETTSSVPTILRAAV
jgi:signal transduction histidine kinase